MRKNATVCPSMPFQARKPVDEEGRGTMQTKQVDETSRKTRIQPTPSLLQGAERLRSTCMTDPSRVESARKAKVGKARIANGLVKISCIEPERLLEKTRQSQSRPKKVLQSLGSPKKAISKNVTPPTLRKSEHLVLALPNQPLQPVAGGKKYGLKKRKSRDFITNLEE
mmetsp:Transcript_4802/g.11407  ORF Transcript_4802/g.11407 Transcript_4802/m.11407 type:complete len:168 (-) Transcript_4802:174-677(-)